MKRLLPWFQRVESERPRLPQLLMWYPHLKPPDPGELAAGYRIRAFRPGDEQGWIELLNATAELGQWDRARLQREIEGPLLREFFALAEEAIVAAAGVYARQREGEEAYEIGWVACHPAHRGRHLGAQVTAAAVRAALALPRRPIFLLSDDFRMPALKVYLKLGFVPDYQHPSYADRWERIFAALGEEYEQYRPSRR